MGDASGAGRAAADDETPRVVVVAAALVDDLDRPAAVLAARRTAPAHLAGRWELPGGKVDPGETPVQALHREIGEELGVQIVLGDKLPGPMEDGLWPLRGPLVMHVWFATVTHGSPAPLQDHDLLRGLDADTLTDVPWLETNAAIVAALGERLRPR